MTLVQKLNIWHWTTLLSYLMLVVLLIIWPTLFYPPESMPRLLLTVIWVFPLLFPAIGIIKRRYYTYAWSQFINMIYFCHATVYLMTSEKEFFIALIEMTLVLIFFSATIVTIQIKKKLTQQNY